MVRARVEHNRILAAIRVPGLIHVVIHRVGDEEVGHSGRHVTKDHWIEGDLTDKAHGLAGRGTQRPDRLGEPGRLAPELRDMSGDWRRRFPKRDGPAAHENPPDDDCDTVERVDLSVPQVPSPHMPIWTRPARHRGARDLPVRDRRERPPERRDDSGTRSPIRGDVTMLISDTMRA